MRTVKPPQRVMQIKWNHSCKMLSKTHQEWPTESINTAAAAAAAQGHLDTGKSISRVGDSSESHNYILLHMTQLPAWVRKAIDVPAWTWQEEGAPRNHIHFLPALFSSWRLPLSFSKCSCFHLVLNCSSPAVWKPLMYKDCLQRQWKSQDPTDLSSNSHSITSISWN